MLSRRLPVLLFGLSFLIVNQGISISKCGQRLLAQSSLEVRRLSLETKFKVGKRKTVVTLEELYRRYAKLVLSTGINLQDGENIYITGNIEHFAGEGELSFVAILEEEAYIQRLGVFTPEFNPQ